MKRWYWLVIIPLLLCIPLTLLAQQLGFQTFGLISPRGYEARLSPSGQLQLTTAAPSSPAQTVAGGSPFDRFQFAYSQEPTNGLQVSSDGKIHVTIDGAIAGSTAWGAITGTLANQTDLQTALDIKAAADGVTFGKSAFTAADFNASAGVISLDYTNAQKATASVPGLLTAADWTTFNAKQAAGTHAASDGATLGLAAFVAADFNCTAGICSINYTNAQKATASVPGLLTAADWTTFNNKQATVTAGAGLVFSGATMSTASTEAGFLTDGGVTSLTCGSSTAGKMQVLDDGSLEYCDGASTAVLRTLGPGVATQTGLTWNVTVASCTGDANNGKLTVNGSSQIVCASDIGGAGGGADITAVGSCLTADCFTAGTPGVNLTYTNATSGTVTLQTVAGALGARTISLPAETGTVCTTGSVCSGYQATLGNAAADGATLGKAAFTAADFDASAGVISLDYTNAQKATASVPGLLAAADWVIFNAKVSLAGTETLTNKRLTAKVTTVASSITFACNIDNSDTCSMQMTGVAGTVTLSAPTGTPTAMQRVLYRLKCTNAQTYAFNGTFRFSTTVAQPTTCAAGKTDYIGAVYNDIEPKWDVVAVDQGH